MVLQEGSKDDDVGEYAVGGWLLLMQRAVDRCWSLTLDSQRAKDGERVPGMLKSRRRCSGGRRGPIYPAMTIMKSQLQRTGRGESS